MTSTFSARSLALLGSAAALALLLDQPAHAHGLASGGLAAGFLHPLSGIDHLLLLIAVADLATMSTERRVLLLRDYDGLEWREIAAMTGKNTDSAAREEHSRAVVALANCVTSSAKEP